MRPRGIGGLQPAFVGRDGELDLLAATYGRAVEQGSPHLVTIMADAGVGKTRLVRELWERLGRESPEPLRRTGRCLAYGHGITYWPLGEILKEQLGILESDPAAVVRSRLGGRDILGLTLGLDTSGELHPLAARDRLHDAWGRGRARASPRAAGRAAARGPALGGGAAVGRARAPAPRGARPVARDWHGAS